MQSSAEIYLYNQQTPQRYKLKFITFNSRKNRTIRFLSITKQVSVVTTKNIKRYLVVCSSANTSVATNLSVVDLMLAFCFHVHQEFGVEGIESGVHLIPK